MKRFKKKVTRITGILILSLRLFISPLFTSAPQAASSTTVTSYGQYYYESGYENANFMYQLTESWLFKNISACSYITFAYDFKDTYDGYVNLTVTAATSFAWQNIHFYCEGAVFTQQPNMTNSSATKSFQVNFQSSRGFKVVLFDTSGSIFNSSSKITVGTSNFNLQPNIADELDALHTSWDYYVPGMSTSLANIANNTSTVASDIAILKGYVDQLEGYVDNLEPLLQDIYFQNQLNQFDFPVYQHSALYWGFAQVRGTSSHPQLEFWRGLPTFYLLMSEVNNSEYTLARAIRVPGKSTVVIYVSSNRLFDNSLFDVYKSGNADISVEYSANYDTSYQNIYNVISITNNSSSVNYVELEPTANMYIMPYYVGSPNNVPDEVKSLFGIEYDNTYTSLLTSIDSGIQAIASNPTVIQETNTIINNYETTFNTVNNVETNVMVDFDPQLTIVNQSITDSGVLSPTSDLVNVGGWVSYVFEFTDAIPMFKIPFYAILVLFVAACLLG